MSFSDTLKRVREDSHVSMRKLASMIGVTPSTISFWESGRMGPSIDSVREICKALCVSADVMLELTDLPEDGVSALSSEEREYILTFRDLDSYGRDVVMSVCRHEAARTRSQAGADPDVKERSASVKPRNKRKGKKEKQIVQQGGRYIPYYDSPAAAGVSSPVGDAEIKTIRVDDGAPSGADFAVRISGDSMEPVIHNGDIVYVKRTNDLKIKDIGIFSVNGETLCKMYYRSGMGDVTLLSINPERESANVTIAADSTNTLTCLGLVLGVKSEPPEYFTKKM